MGVQLPALVANGPEAAFMYGPRPLVAVAQRGSRQWACRLDAIPKPLLQGCPLADHLNWPRTAVPQQPRVVHDAPAAT